tara:strand:- start:16499 stop:17503 length:1005 start_codon:yes stop_codon:yes gene_type:complete
MIRILLLSMCLGVTLLWSKTSSAQDPQYSQFYSNPMYLNPAFTGNTRGNRFVANFRNQWPSIPGAFISYSASYDANVQDLNSGVGLRVNYDKAGTGGLRYTEINGAYAYTIRISRKVAARPAISLGYVVRDLDWSKLTFGDQLYTGSNTSYASGLIREQVTYMDVSSGVLVYGLNFWAGYSVMHLNEPNNSLLDDENRLPARHSVHVGYHISLRRSVKKVDITSLTIAANYKAQRKWDQFDLGGYFQYKPLVLGIWYRGLPIIKNNESSAMNHDALIVIVGYDMDRWRFAYSYDMTLSKLWLNTGGSHEISLIYEWAKPKRRRRRYIMAPCPQF